MPGGPVLRTLVAASALFYTWGDLPYLRNLESPLEIAAGGMLYAPVFVLAFSIRLAAALWILVATAGLLLASTVTSQLVAASVVAIVLNALVSFSLPLRERCAYWIAFAGYVLAHAWLVEGGFRVAVVVATLFLLAGLMGRFVAKYRLRWERESKRVERLQQVQKQVRAEERQVIARELHDIVAHDVTVIIMQARRARFLEPAKREEVLEFIGDIGQSTLRDLRQMLLALRRTDETEVAGRSPGHEDRMEMVSTADGLASVSAVAVSDSVEQVAEALRGAGMEVDLEIVGDVCEVPTVIRTVLHRMVRELGTNILKHGEGASRVEMRVRVAEGGVMVRTRNRVGPSVAPVMSSGIGIEAMKTRAEVYGGTITMGMTADHDWTARIWLPYTSGM